MTRPRILINFAITADGKTSTVSKDPAHFTSKADLRRLLEIRKRADAILVGRATLEADQMTMTIPAELDPRRQPRRCVVSRSGGFDPGHKLFHSDGGPIHLLATEPGADFDAGPFQRLGATVHTGSLPDFLHRLRTEHEIRTLLCEGGGSLVRSLAELDAIDEINLTFAGHTLYGGQGAPTLMGTVPDYLPRSLEFELAHFEPQADGELFLTYTRDGNSARRP